MIVPGRRGWTGLLVGFGGVIGLLGLDVTGSLAAAGAVLFAASGYAVATVLIGGRLSEVAPLGVSGSALGIAALMLLPGAATSLPATASGSAWAAMLTLGVLCTAAAFGLYYLLIAQAGGTRASLTTYLSPIFSILAGATILGETVTIGSLAGIALILGGSWLTTSDPRTRPERSDQNAARQPRRRPSHWTSAARRPRP